MSVSGRIRSSLYVQAVKEEEDRRRKAEEEAAKASSFSRVTCLRPEIRRCVDKSQAKPALFSSGALILPGGGSSAT